VRDAIATIPPKNHAFCRPSKGAPHPTPLKAPQATFSQ
jgi:hypothetical protein